MAQLRIQAGDFQDAGLEGNLSKLETIVEDANAIVANGKSLAGIDVVGDWYDGHDDRLVQHLIDINIKELEKSDPEASKLISEFQESQTKLSKLISEKYGGDKRKLSEEDIAEFREICAKVEKNRNAVAILNIGHVQASEIVYGQQTKILEKLNEEITVFSVRGNNDTNFVQDHLKSVTFVDLEERLTENGPFKIIGANNSFEYLIGYKEEEVVKYDDAETLEKSVAYQKFNLEKTGKRANIMILHGPPDGVGFRTMKGKDGKPVESDTGGKGIPKLIEEHQPALVECGHFHKWKLYTRDGITYARTSPNAYFVHEFDDDGNYLKTKIYSYN